ncbi:MAG: helix-turn-helix domain-containing protein [Parvibaculales bacterium]
MADKQIQTVGDILKNRREHLQQELADIALTLRIRREHLEAIETDNLEALPAEAYAIGFIRTYARHLELDETQLVALFKQQSSSNGAVSFDFPEMDEKREIPGTALAFGLLGLVLTAYFFVAFLTDAQTVSQNKVSQDSRVTQEAAAPEGVDMVSEDQEKSTAVTAPEDESTSPPADVQTPVPESEVAALTQAPDIIRVEPLPETVEEAAAPPSPVAAPQPLLSIRARGETWMRVVTDEGRILFSSIIVEGERFDFPPGEKFRLATQNAGRLEYVINGESVGLVGGRGQTLANRVVNVPRLLERFAVRPEM